MHFLLIDPQHIVITLTIILVFFGVLLVLGIRKSYKLKKEDEELHKISEKLSKEDKKTYEDFTDGHMYQ